MSHEELQTYLQAQLEEIRRYQRDEHARGRAQLDLRQAIQEWIERFGADYQEGWLREHPHAANDTSVA